MQSPSKSIQSGQEVESQDQRGTEFLALSNKKWTPDEQKVFFQAQAALMAVMISRGTLKDQERFATRVAPLIRAIVEGELYISDSAEHSAQVQRMREDFAKIVSRAYRESGLSDAANALPRDRR